MCRINIILACASYLNLRDVLGKRVIEVGSNNVNGSLRPIIEAMEPQEYVGVDIVEGPGVDLLCGAENLVQEFGEESFDLVISTEMLEHVQDWKQSINNMKRICRPDGVILITTRSIGYPFHGHPADFWRFETEDMRSVFSDFEIARLERDEIRPGVFMKAIKPENCVLKNISDYKAYSIISSSRTNEAASRNKKTMHYRISVIRFYLRRTIVRLIRLLLSGRGV
jgi:SAM-dependent methyltransferase